MECKETVLEDKQIIELFLSRSEQAIYEAEIKYGRYCHKIAFNILGNDEDSEECVNDALMRLWSSIPPNEPQSLSSFVGRITRNLALDRLRQKNSDKRGGGEIPLVLDEISEFVSGGDQIERLHESQEITDALNSFLGELGKVERGVFMRRYWLLETVADVAEHYGLTVSNTTTMLFRLRKKLKKHLMKEGIAL